MKFLCLLKILFIKLLVSSILKEKKIQDDKSKIRSLSIGSAVYHFNSYTTVVADDEWFDLNINAKTLTLTFCTNH